MGAVIDERMWKHYSDKLPDSEALNVLREVISYITKRLGSMIDDIDVWRGGVAFFTKDKEFLTVNVTTKGLRIYFYPFAGWLVKNLSPNPNPRAHPNGLEYSPLYCVIIIT